MVRNGKMWTWRGTQQSMTGSPTSGLAIGSPIFLFLSIPQCPYPSGTLLYFSFPGYILVIWMIHTEIQLCSNKLFMVCGICFWSENWLHMYPFWSGFLQTWSGSQTCWCTTGAILKLKQHPFSLCRYILLFLLKCGWEVWWIFPNQRDCRGLWPLLVSSARNL